MSRLRIVVGCQGDERGDDAVALAGVLARQLHADVVLAHILPPATPRVGAVDVEWRSYLRFEAAEVLDDAERRLAVVAPALTPERVFGAHRGSGRGLAQLAEEHEAALVVVGSSPDAVEPGRLAIGSTADQLLHGSPAPVAIAPWGYAAAVPERLERCTIAYLASERSASTLACGSALASRLHTGVRLLTLLIHPRPLHSGRQHMPVEQQIVAAARHQLLDDLTEAASLLPPGLTVERELVEGPHTVAAVAAAGWGDELMMCAASDVGPLTRVFVGSGSLKLVRAARTPVVVFPRETQLGNWVRDELPA